VAGFFEHGNEPSVP